MKKRVNKIIEKYSNNRRGLNYLGLLLRKRVRTGDNDELVDNSKILDMGPFYFDQYVLYNYHITFNNNVKVKNLIFENADDTIIIPKLDMDENTKIHMFNLISLSVIGTFNIIIETHKKKYKTKYKLNVVENLFSLPYKVNNVSPSIVYKHVNEIQFQVETNDQIDNNKLGNFELVSGSNVVPLTVMSNINKVIKFNIINTSNIQSNVIIKVKLDNNNYVRNLNYNPNISTLQTNIITESPDYNINNDLLSLSNLIFMLSLNRSLNITNCLLVQINQLQNELINGYQTIISNNDISSNISKNITLSDLPNLSAFKLKLNYVENVNNLSFNFTIYGNKIYTKLFNITDIIDTSLYLSNLTSTVSISLKTSIDNVTNVIIPSESYLEDQIYYNKGYFTSTNYDINSLNQQFVFNKTNLTNDRYYQVYLKTIYGITKTLTTKLIYVTNYDIKVELVGSFVNSTDTTALKSANIVLDRPLYVKFRFLNNTTGLEVDGATVVSYKYYNGTNLVNPSPTTYIGSGTANSTSLSRFQIYISLDQFIPYSFVFTTDSGKEYTIKTIYSLYNLLGNSPVSLSTAVVAPLPQIKIRVNKTAVLANLNSITFNVHNASTYDPSNKAPSIITTITGTMVSISQGWLSVNVTYTPSVNRTIYKIATFTDKNGDNVLGTDYFELKYDFGRYVYVMSGGDSFVGTRAPALTITNMAQMNSHLSSVIRPYGANVALKTNNYLGYDFPTATTGTNVVPSLNEILQRNRSRKDLPYVIIYGFKLNNVFKPHQISKGNSLFPVTGTENQTIYKSIYSFASDFILPTNNSLALGSSNSTLKCSLWFSLKTDTRKYITSTTYSIDSYSKSSAYEPLRTPGNYTMDDFIANKGVQSIIDLNSFYYSPTPLYYNFVPFLNANDTKEDISDTMYSASFNSVSNSSRYFKYLPNTNIAGNTSSLANYFGTEFYFAFYPNGNIYMLQYANNTDLVKDSDISQDFAWTLLPIAWTPSYGQIYPTIDYIPMVYTLLPEATSLSAYSLKDSIRVLKPDAIDPTTIVTANPNFDEMVLNPKYALNEGWVYKDITIKGYMNAQYATGGIVSQASCVSKTTINFWDLMLGNNLIANLTFTDTNELSTPSIDLTVTPNFSFGQSLDGSGSFLGAWSKRLRYDKNNGLYYVMGDFAGYVPSASDTITQVVDGISTVINVLDIVYSAVTGDFWGAVGGIIGTILPHVWDTNTYETTFRPQDLFAGLAYGSIKGKYDGPYLIMYGTDNVSQNLSIPFIGINFDNGYVCYGNRGSYLPMDDDRPLAAARGIKQQIKFCDPTNSSLPYISGTEIHIRSHIPKYTSGYPGQYNRRAYEYKSNNMKYWIPLYIPNFWSTSCKQLFEPTYQRIKFTIGNYWSVNESARTSIYEIPQSAIDSGYWSNYNTSQYPEIVRNLIFDVYNYHYTKTVEPNTNIEYTPVSIGVYKGALVSTRTTTTASTLTFNDINGGLDAPSPMAGSSTLQMYWAFYNSATGFYNPTYVTGDDFIFAFQLYNNGTSLSFGNGYYGLGIIIDSNGASNGIGTINVSGIALLDNGPKILLKSQSLTVTSFYYNGATTPTSNYGFLTTFNIPATTYVSPNSTAVSMVQSSLTTLTDTYNGFARKNGNLYYGVYASSTWRWVQLSAPVLNTTSFTRQMGYNGTNAVYQTMPQSAIDVYNTFANGTHSSMTFCTLSWAGNGTTAGPYATYGGSWIMKPISITWSALPV